MMSAKNLRDSILQMAVEGKLVEQREEEGTAADLLASIREQRAQLVREKKAKPVKGGESIIWRDDDGHWFERRGKGEAVCIDDEIPFDIPDSWCWDRLGGLIDLKSGVDLNKNSYSDTKKTGIPYITGASNFRDGQILENRWTDSPKRESEKGDLLFTCKGTVGEMAYNPFPRAHIARQIMAIKASEDGMLEYVRLFLEFHVNKVKAVAKGVIPGIERADLTESLIPVPPLAEQERIVEKIDELMPHIDEYGKAQEQREQLNRELPVKLRKSVLQAAIEGKLTEQSDDDEPASVLLAGIREQRAQLVREKKVKPVKGGESVIYRDDAGHWFERRGKSDPVCIDEEIPFDIPDSWSWARLNSLATLTRGSGIKRSEVREEGLPCVRYGELYTTYDTEIRTPHSFVDQGIFEAAKKIGPDDLILTLTGENDIDIGRAVINRTGETIAFGGDLLSIADTQMDREYLLVALRSPALSKQRTQASTGNIIVHLGAEKVGRFLIPVPPLAEQRQIVDKYYYLVKIEALKLNR